MSLPTIPKTIFNSSIKLARTPVDLALGAFGGSESGAKNLVDRAEAGARSATGVLFRDEELREEGPPPSWRRKRAGGRSPCASEPRWRSARPQSGRPSWAKPLRR